jgi:hypothetical protein
MFFWHCYFVYSLKRYQKESNYNKIEKRESLKNAQNGKIINVADAV